MFEYEKIEVELDESEKIKNWAETKDFQESINAFLEKRKPIFKGE